MAAAIGLITIGGLLVASALKGVGLTDLIAGVVGGTKLNPAGGSKEFPAGTTVTGQPNLVNGTQVDTGDILGGLSTDTGAMKTGPNVPKPVGFKGPHADLLLQLAGIASARFGLTITATTNGGHVPGSYHYQGRAFDAAGSEANMRAFAHYIASHPASILELIHNPGPAIKNGKSVNGATVYAAVWLGHRDHVHVAA